MVLKLRGVRSRLLDGANVRKQETTRSQSTYGHDGNGKNDVGE